MNTIAATTRRDLRPMRKGAPCRLLELSSATRGRPAACGRLGDLGRGLVRRCSHH